MVRILIISILLLGFTTVTDNDIETEFSLFGEVKTRNVQELKRSNWSVGTETTGRHYTNYMIHAY